MSNRLINPASQFFDSAGVPYVGGKIYVYVTATSTPTDTYTDSALTTPNTNPIVLDSAGRLPDDCFLDPSVTYKIVLKDANNVTVFTRDPVSDPAANVTAAFRVYAGDPNTHVAGSTGSVGGSSASAIFDITNDLLWVCTTTGTALTAVWTQVGATLTGAVSFSTILSPPSLAAGPYNDYEPTDFTTASHLRQAASADVVFTGMKAGTAGRMLVWTNVSTSNIQTFRVQSSLSVASNRFAIAGDTTVEPGQSIWFWYDTTTARWRMIGSAAANMMGDPGGRLTVSTGEPVITSDVTGATSIYYTPYKHNYAKLYDGSTWYPVQFSELSQLLSDTTKSPLGAAVSQVYDMFLWDDSGTLRCTRGPAWTSSTARGTGAGTTEIERVDGIYVNKIAITNGPAARRGLYVGTICINSSSVVLKVQIAPAAAAGGANARVDVWNTFNRVPIGSISKDSTDATWAYTLTTFRMMNNSASNRISFVIGLNEDAITATVILAAYNAGGFAIYAGVGLTSETVASGFIGTHGASVDRPTQIIGSYVGLPQIGQRYVQALEAAEAANTANWSGDDGGTKVTTGIAATWLY